MKNYKKIAISILTGVSLILSLASCQTKKESSTFATSSVPISRIQGTFVIDVDNPLEVIGSADYYFVAYVNSVDGTEYKSDFPYTNYTITVIENIKGDLITEKSITIQKDGGLTSDGKWIQLYEDDELMEAGQYYAITAHSRSDDGSLLISGPNSNKKVEASEIKKAPNERFLLEKENYSKEIPMKRFKRTRSLSKYDRSFANESEVQSK